MVNKMMKNWAANAFKVVYADQIFQVCRALFTLSTLQSDKDGGGAGPSVEQDHCYVKSGPDMSLEMVMSGHTW